MKFLCGILILSGVFALNAASVPEAQMRIANEKLRAAAEDRALNDPKCFADYLAVVTALLEEYQGGLKKCEDAKATEIAALNSTLQGNLASLSSTVENSCGSLQECGGLEPAIDGIRCLNAEAAKSSNSAKQVSTLAATYGTEYDKNIANCEGVEKVCTEQCNADYTTKSAQADIDFNNCKNEVNPPPAEETTTTTTTTVAPETEAPAPPPEGGEGRRSNNANKYRRF